MARITDFDAALYGVPTEESLEDATQSFDELEFVIADVETGDGTTGRGFTYTIGEGGEAILAFLEEIADEIEGTSAAPRVARDHIRAATTFVGREGISELAIAAVDIALWDALGRRAGLPLYELLGGECDPVPAYRTDGGWLQYDESTLVENAERIATGGFRGMKMKVGRSLAEDERRVRAVRDALSPNLDLFLDGNCGYSLPEARRLAGRLDDLDIRWFEEPLPKGDYAGYADLREAVDVPIAAGENLYSETQFEQLIESGGADVLQPDVCRVGGITPWVAVCETARAAGLPVVPHYVEPLHVHLALPFDNVPLVERHSSVLDTVLASPLDFEGGAAQPPEGPGHGIEFEGLDAYRKYTIGGKP